MNVILFIFITLAATFISSSANNLYSITTAMEAYFQMAGLPDYLIMTLEEKENDEAIIHFLKDGERVWTAGKKMSTYIVEQNRF